MKNVLMVLIVLFVASCGMLNKDGSVTDFDAIGVDGGSGGEAN